MSFVYLRLIFLPAILIPAYASFSPVFLIMYSTYKLDKQGDSIQPWCTPFLIWNQSVGLCPVLTVASWPEYRFLRRQVRWSGILIYFRIFQFIVIHTVKGFGIVNKAEIDVFLELAFLMIQWMLVIWSLVPLPFLKTVWTSGSSWFTYCWSLAWRILSTTLLVCEVSAIKLKSINHNIILYNSSNENNKSILSSLFPFPSSCSISAPCVMRGNLMWYDLYAT